MVHKLIHMYNLVALAAPDSHPTIVTQHGFQFLINLFMVHARQPKVNTAQSADVFVVFLFYKFKDYVFVWLNLKHFEQKA